MEKDRKMDMKNWIRNTAVFTPTVLLLVALLQFVLARRTVGFIAYGVLVAGLVVSALPTFGRWIERHKTACYGVAAVSWLICAGRVGWFVARVTQ